jgi:ABC-type transport system involved in multi-copper enzyme maturation permease subunit
VTSNDAPSALRILTRHFFSSFFRLSFLDDAGEESFKKALIGLLTAVIGAGLLVTRLYITKYRALGEVEMLPAIVAADRLFIVAVPMFITALALALVVHSIFPDELDFRTMMALPLKRRTVFAAKFVALAAFLCIFAGGSVLGFTVPLAVIVSGRSAEGRLGILVQIGVGAMACGFTVSLLVAIEGLIAVALPRAWMRPASVYTQTTCVALLVASVPFLLRMPGWWRVMADPPAWLLAVPPAWFLGVAQWAMGAAHPRWAQLAIAAAAGTAITAIIALASALWLYARFDQTVLRSSTAPGRSRWRTGRWRLASGSPAQEAVRDFIATTIRRSGLHQLIVYSLTAAGVALAVNRWLGAIGQRERWVIVAALSVPFMLMAGVVVGLRTALLVPTNLRAGWIFRFLEDAATRRHQLTAVRRSLFVAGAVWPALLSVPVHAMVLGWTTAFTLAPLTLLIGWFFTEAACLDWRRIPFTCTFLFGKRSPAFTIAMAILVFGWFVFLSAALLNTARVGLLPWLLVALLVGPIGLALRQYRLQHWGDYPLEFEDYLPDGIETLRLTE